MGVACGQAPMSTARRCLELSPTENIWQYLRQNWLSKRIFNSYDDILDTCCEAWNKLVAFPGTITSVALRAWAHPHD